jgi:cyclopropane-fatty-acyl-phospholipid synthase
MNGYQTERGQSFWLVRKLIKSLAKLHYGRLHIDLPGSTPIVFTGREPGPEARVTLHRPRSCAIRVLLREATGLGEGYMAGDWSTNDLGVLMHLLAMNQRAWDDGLPLARIGTILDRIHHVLRRNSRPISRRNISHHYDLGNDFYRLWLDETMTYSSALFPAERGGTALAEAQERKYARLLSQLGAAPGEHILEIGCGWGGFLEHAARAGMRVTGITLSREQRDYAAARMRSAGLENLARVELIDYRDVSGTFDHIVSIEMFEAVGEHYWRGYFDRIRQLMGPGGRAALQVITIEDARFEQYRRSADFIQKYIFPGGMLPSVQQFNTLSAERGLRIREQAFFGLHYADTLRIWNRRFHEQDRAIRQLGFDDRFMRMWSYYLAYCEGGFRAGQIDLMQVVLDSHG